MSLSKTRFRSVLNYEEESKPLGCCCNSNGTLSSDVTFNECNSNNGYWRQKENDNCSDCPKFEEPGWCCSCAYVTDMDSWLSQSTQTQGLQSGVTPCSCYSNGGAWVSNDVYNQYNSSGDVNVICSPTSGIPYAPDDVRWPGACCYVDDSGDIQCENTCNGDACGEIGGTANLFYDDGSVCGYNGSNGQDPRECSIDDTLRFGRTLYAGEPEHAVGKFSACTHETEGSIKCELLTEEQCIKRNGFFHGFDADNNYKKCNNILVRSSKTKTQSILEDSISESFFNDFEVGSDFFGFGIFAGIFTLGSPVTRNGSTIKYSSESTGNVYDISSNSRGAGNTKYSKWAIIVDYIDCEFNDPTSSYSGIETSTWDGYYNTFSILKSTSDLVKIKNKKVNGIQNSYIPSVQESGFIQKNLFENKNANTLLLKNSKWKYPFTFSYTTSTSKVISGQEYKYLYLFSGYDVSKELAVSSSIDYRKFVVTTKQNSNTRIYTGKQTVDSDKAKIILSGVSNKHSIRLVRRINIV